MDDYRGLNNLGFCKEVTKVAPRSISCVVTTRNVQTCDAIFIVFVDDIIIEAVAAIALYKVKYSGAIENGSARRHSYMALISNYRV
jgi:hypothetical protein